MGSMHKNERADPVDDYVGQKVKVLRMQNGVTQAGLADALGVTFQQVQKYEKGVNRMAASTLMKAADCLGCDIADLFPPKTAEGGRDRTDLELGELADLYERMSPRQREAMRVMARALAPSASRDRRRAGSGGTARVQL